MQTKTQRAFMAAAVAGIALMGFAGWWVGGMGVAKAPVAVADAAVTPEVVAAPEPVVSPAVADHAVTVEQPVVRELRPLKVQRDPATGNVIITGDNGPQGMQTGIVRLNRLEAAGGGKVVMGGPTAVTDGTLTLETVKVDGNDKVATGIAKVDTNGNVTTFTITSGGGTTRLISSNGGTISVDGKVVINGNSIVIRDGQGRVQASKVIEPTAMPEATPGLP